MKRFPFPPLVKGGGGGGWAASLGHRDRIFRYRNRRTTGNLEQAFRPVYQPISHVLRPLIEAKKKRRVETPFNNPVSDRAGMIAKAVWPTPLTPPSQGGGKKTWPVATARLGSRPACRRARSFSFGAQLDRARRL